MQELSNAEMLIINGGSSIVACTSHSLINLMKWISKLLRF